VRRVLVVGTTGSGKTTVARELARQLAVPHIELDELYWLPGWQSPDEDVFRAHVADAIDGTDADGWVVCGNYRPQTVDITWPHADTVVWLDLPRRVVFTRIVRRTASRIFRRQELYNGNRETWRSALAPEGILRWALFSFDRNRDRYCEMSRDPNFAHIEWIRLHRRRDVRRFLRSAV